MLARPRTPLSTEPGTACVANQMTQGLMSKIARPPDFLAREMVRPRREFWILLAICAVVRLSLMPINTAEYTDGVIQAMMFVEPTGIWPPLYGAVIYILKFVFGYLWAGRLASVVASILAFLPIYFLARRAFGTRAALYAGIFYIVAPVANRWGIRLMSDATFSLFFFWAVERMCFAADERDRAAAFRAYGWACVATVMASLTRYQGPILLGPPLLGLAILLIVRFRAIPWKPSLNLLGMALLPIWIHLTSETFIHGEQFAQRAFTESPMPTWKVLLLNGEAFIAYMPYWLTYPVAVFVLLGIFWMRQRRGIYFGLTLCYVAVALLVMQSLFSSFQERYFLPLLGFFWVLAGAGLYALQERWRRQARGFRNRLFPYIAIGTFVWSGAFSLMVLLGQRDAFGDIARASRYAAEVKEPQARIFTNEVWRMTPVIMAANKVEFFAGTDAHFLHDGFVPSPGFTVTETGGRRLREIGRAHV